MMADADVPHDLAYGLVASSAWWLRHPSGTPVRAPNHAQRLVASSNLGWIVEFGANGFAAGYALSQARIIARDVMQRYQKGEAADEAQVRALLGDAVKASVFNHAHELYSPGTYHIEGNDLVFGVQSIDVKDCVDHLIELTGLKELLSLKFDEYEA
jgi:hypothetical protein